MGDSDDSDRKRQNDFANLPALFKEWQGVVVVIGGAITAVLAKLLPKNESTVQIIGYAIAVALVAVGGFVFIRVRRRQQSKQRREKRRETWEREMAEAHQMAFRGLFPYQENDNLPGEHRQREALRLVTQFSEPTFSFGVVCGDSGCGKTSLLRSAIQRRLKIAGAEKGFSVLYLSNPRELAGDSTPHGERPDIARKLRKEMDKLRQLAADASQSKPLVLIIDQFEEFFIEYSKPEQRLEIGKFINGLIKSSPPVRILCAIRRDYLADMKDLTPQSPEPVTDGSFFELISFQSVFNLKNFTVEQAARVIKECAERDRIEIDDEFAETLATDLAEGDFVRPPELQIVCTALVGNLTMAEYRLLGGARGILSHHIESAIDISGDPNVVRRVLRALCDFPAHAKRNPQTLPTIAEIIGAEGAQALGLIRTALRQFEAARLVVSEKRDEDELGYALVHDYLVDAVSKATSDVSTRDEEANQMLDYYVSEYRSDAKTRIPYRRLRFVGKYADRKKLADPTAKRLVRASMMRLVTTTVALSAIVVVATTLIVAYTTTRREWHQELLNNHWEGNDSGEMTVLTQRKRSLVITGNGSDTARTTFSKYIKLWDDKTAKLVDKVEGNRIRFIKPDYIFSKFDNNKSLNAYHIPTRNRFQSDLPYVPGLTDADEYDSSPAVQSHSGEIIVVGKTESYDSIIATVFSTATNTKVNELRTCGGGMRRGIYYVTNDGSILITECDWMFDSLIATFNIQTEKKRVLLRDGYESMGRFSVNRSESQVATLERARDGQIYVVLWNLRNSGEPEHSPALAQFKSDENDISRSFWNVRFTQDDALLYVTQGLLNMKAIILRASDLRRVKTVPENNLVYISGSAADDDDDDEKRPIFLAWPNGPDGGAYLWDLMEAEPMLMKSLILPEGLSALRFNTVKDRFLVVREKEARIELWSSKEDRKLADLASSSRFSDAQFTIDGNAVSVNLEDGTVTLYSSDNGKKIAELHNIGGSNHQIYFDKECHRVNIWTDKGRVLRYTDGWYLFGREKLFWPASKCQAQ